MTIWSVSSRWLDVFEDEVSVLQPRDGSLGSDISCCAEFGIMCASGESYSDLILLRDDCGGGLYEFFEERLAFAGLISRSQSVC